MTTEMDLVGLAMTVKLTNDTVFSGTVFTYVPEHDILVLAVNANSDSPNFKMIKTTFIQSYTVDPDPKHIPDDQRLPPSLDAFQHLPPMTKAVKDFNSAKKKVVSEEKKRDSQLQKLVGAPVAATELVLQLTRVFPQAEWNAEEKILKLDEVVVVGEPDWSNPVVKIVKDSDASSSVKERIEQSVKKFLETATV
mmetsp:Transcript_81800/g.95481  ORF Transcript_81800/g.95481 Transcript_81800/m.95481 type:complete len:194 (+) Transcript_81800:106-687(+)